jgi:hypothetical protein
MRFLTVIGATVGTVLLGITVARSFQAPAVRAVDETTLREYVGVYQWDAQAFVYLQMWDEFSGFTNPSQLVAFDESGEVRTLYPTDRDQFFTGPGAAVPTSVQAQIEFQRDGTGAVTSLTWRREGAAPRTAQRVEIEEHEDIRFLSGDVELAGTLMSPVTGGRHPAVILVHGSGAENREYILPYARFLIRHGMAVLGYDKRGVDGSTGDWNTASYDDLAGDVVAAFEYLKTRSDIDREQIGVLGVSQAGWVMPLAALRATDIAFLISISGAGVTGAETGIDHARAEMTAAGMRPQMVERILSVTRLQYRFAETGQGWEEYAAAREGMSAQLGPPPDTIPGTPDDPYWDFMRRLFFYDPAPTLRQLRVPTLALFGEMDNNILAEKNEAAWEAALSAGVNPDYTLRTLPRANHLQFESEVGNNAEMATLQRFVPEYSTTIRNWLAERIRGFEASQ